eukprot:scaffold52553_cov74-Phaeocystis_antarctica.AAC.4
MDATTDDRGPVVDSAGRVGRLAASVGVSDMHIPTVLLLLYGRVYHQNLRSERASSIVHRSRNEMHCNTASPSRKVRKPSQRTT